MTTFWLKTWNQTFYRDTPPHMLLEPLSGLGTLTISEPGSKVSSTSFRACGNQMKIFTPAIRRTKYLQYSQNIYSNHQEDNHAAFGSKKDFAPSWDDKDVSASYNLLSWIILKNIKESCFKIFANVLNFLIKLQVWKDSQFGISQWEVATSRPGHSRKRGKREKNQKKTSKH